ncbi:MAG: hypothetical protein ABIN18_19275 [Pseudomonadota bacterium]
MKESLKSPRIIINKLQVLIGLVCLFLGTLVYLFYRPPDQTYFIYISGLNISLYNTLPNIFGLVGNSLPAFIHVFAFILITAGLLGCRKREFIIICLSWLLVDCAFELGQKFNMWSSKIIPDWFIHVPFLENSKHYFLFGTFDFFDLAATTIGAVIAYFVLINTMGRRQIGL